MKHRLIPAMLVGLAIALTQSIVSAEKPEDCACPVSGKPAKAANSVDYKEMKVYFCCPNCPKAFEANPEKFANKAALQLACTEQIVQKACPISGRPLNAETAIDVQGVSVAFCCENCPAKVENASKDEQLKLVFGDLDKAWEKAK